MSTAVVNQPCRCPAVLFSKSALLRKPFPWVRNQPYFLSSLHFLSPESPPTRSLVTQMRNLKTMTILNRLRCNDKGCLILSNVNRHVSHVKHHIKHPKNQQLKLYWLSINYRVPSFLFLSLFVSFSYSAFSSYLSLSSFSLFAITQK